MNKPTSLKIQEFQKSILNIINNSELPLYLVKYIIKDLSIEIDNTFDDLAKKEINEYYKSLNEQEKDTSEEVID